MAVHQVLEWASVDELNLDPQNPRLGRAFLATNPSQPDILKKLAGWTLDELAVSFLESGFWIQEALLVVEEDHGDGLGLYVVEGNRRLAAIKGLVAAYDGNQGETPRGFAALAADFPRPDQLFQRIPYIRADSRADVSAYLGYRHVTGIKEWRPAEKAEFIARLIDEEGLTYDQVRRRIGSKTPSVRQNYISYKLLRQVGELQDDADSDKVEERFGVLYRSLNATGVQEYLGVNLRAEPEEAAEPVPAQKQENLNRFTRWVFGTDDRPPIFTDSRQVDNFAALLSNDAARTYLEESKNPSFDVAVELAADDSDNIVSLIKEASYSIRVALGTAHRHRENDEVRKAVEVLIRDTVALARQLPSTLDVARQELA